VPSNRTKRRLAPAHQNGHYHGPIPPPPVQAGPMPRIEVWLPLADEYPGWMFLFWQNHPRQVMRDLRAAQGDTATWDVFKSLVRAHNGWTDERGVVYPQTDDDEFWGAIPNQVALALYQRVQDQAWTLPNSLTPRPPSTEPTSATEPSAEAPVDSVSPGSSSDES
jgi:hypothetical protein